MTGVGLNARCNSPECLVPYRVKLGVPPVGTAVAEKDPLNLIRFGPAKESDSAARFRKNGVAPASDRLFVSERLVLHVEGM